VFNAFYCTCMYVQVIERAAELQAAGMAGPSKANGVRTSQAVSDRKSRVTVTIVFFIFILSSHWLTSIVLQI
jgi:hypothetical protein